MLVAVYGFEQSEHCRVPGSNYFVRVLSILDRELLKPGCSVALHKYSNALVDVLPPEADSTIQMLRADEKPDVCLSFFFCNPFFNALSSTFVCFPSHVLCVYVLLINSCM